VAEIVSEEQPQPAEESLVRKKPDIIVQHRRFGLAYFLLAIAVGIAVGLSIVLYGRGGSSHHAQTGTQVFEPTKPGELCAKQIAHHVGREYRLSNGNPLAAVVGQRPNYQGQPLSFYLIRPNDAKYPKDIAIFDVGEGMMYTMCGFGKNCAAGSAGANNDENLLLKREALELSLDTFKADSSVQTVTTLLPPLAQGNLAIIFKRSDLGSWIHKPLSTILSAKTQIKPGQMSDEEALRVDTLEAGALFQFDAVQGPDGNAYLRLDPIG